MAEVAVRPLEPGDDRSDFVSGDPDLDRFSRQYGFEELEILEGTLGDRPPPIPMFLPLGAVPDLRTDEK